MEHHKQKNSNVNVIFSKIVCNNAGKWLLKLVK